MGEAGYPEGFQRVSAALSALGHAHAPRWLEASARTSQEAADALGVTVGQIAKSVVFRRVADVASAAVSSGAAGAPLETAVLVVASGDRRVDEKRVTALVCQAGGRLARADAAFVKASTGFSIGGVAPLAHTGPVLTLIDRDLFRFDEIWAAAGHPNGVFKLAPAHLAHLTGGAPVVDVVLRLEGAS